MKYKKSLVVGFCLLVVVPNLHAFELPPPLSQEDRDRLRKQGEENGAKYGTPAPTTTPQPVIVVKEATSAVIVAKPTPDTIYINDPPLATPPKLSWWQKMIGSVIDVVLKILGTDTHEPEKAETPVLIIPPTPTIVNTPSEEAFCAYGNCYEPGTAGYHFEKGFDLWITKKDWQGAKAEYAKALAIDPNHAPALSSYGYLIGAFEYNYVESEEKLKKAIELDPTWAYAPFNLAIIYMSQGKMEEAYKWKAYTLEKFKNHPDYDHFSKALSLW